LSAAPPTSTPPPGTGPLWGNHAGSGAPTAQHASGGEQLDPLSRRLLRLAGLLAVLLLLVLANSFLHGDESPLEDPLQLNPVASAAERVEKVAGGRLSLYIVYSSPAVPRPIVASGGGAYNEKTDRSRIVLKMSNPLTGAAMQMVQIKDGDVEYTGGEMVRDELPPGKEWMRIDESEESEEDETPLSMEDSLEMLDSSGKIEMVGRESVNGKTTRRYRGEIQLGDLVDFLREKGKDTEADAYERIEGLSPTQISAEAWVDGKNLLRRMRMVMPMPGEPGEPPVTVDMRMDFFDYGAQPDIQLPDPGRVLDGPLDEAGASGSLT
jgi:hypothetical protein